MSSTDNKRIAKNTLALYIRMLLIMLITLYTSRVVLQQLGEVDYGIYNVVGGFVTMLSFLSLALSNSTQRFIIFYIGKGNDEQLEKVFSTAILSHLSLAIIIVIACEIIGLWYIHNIMVLPPERLKAALISFHFAVASLAVVVISVPYYADIIAHEKMSVYAVISIVDALLRLLVAFAISASSFDRLIVYAALMLFTQVIIQLLYRNYSKRNFKEARFKYTFSPNLFKEMMSFTGWTVIGNLAFTLHSQGTNMVLNYFFGPVVNTARGLAMQVQNSIVQFCNSFQTSVNPQIIKTYASGQLRDMNLLILRSSKVSFFLLYFISLPLFFETEAVLTIWLKEVPEYLVGFVRISVFVSMMTALANPLGTAVSATGNIKKYQLIIGGVLLLNVPFSYLLLRIGMSPYIVYIVQFIIECVALVLRLTLFNNLISLSIIEYLKTVIFRIVLTLPICCALVYLFKMYFPLQGIYELIVVTLVCWCVSAIVIWLLGMTKNEKIVVVNFIINKINEWRR